MRVDYPGSIERCGGEEVVVISAKISEELLDDIEYLRIALDIPTRQEFIERALRLFIFSCYAQESKP